MGGVNLCGSPPLSRPHRRPECSGKLQSASCECAAGAGVLPPASLSPSSSPALRRLAIPQTLRTRPLRGMRRCALSLPMTAAGAPNPGTVRVMRPRCLRFRPLPRLRGSLGRSRHLRPWRPEPPCDRMRSLYGRPRGTLPPRPEFFHRIRRPESRWPPYAALIHALQCGV